MSRTDAVEALYQDMASRHSARFRTIHVSFAIVLQKSLFRTFVIDYVLVRSSKWLKLKRPKISDVHISGNSSPRT